MANTVAVILSATAWIDVSLAAANGLVTNESNKSVVVKEADSLPDPSDLFGHTLYSGSNGYYNWAGISGTIYARTIPSSAGGSDVKIAVTRS